MNSHAIALSLLLIIPSVTLTSDTEATPKATHSPRSLAELLAAQKRSDAGDADKEEINEGLLAKKLLEKRFGRVALEVTTDCGPTTHARRQSQEMNRSEIKAALKARQAFLEARKRRASFESVLQTEVRPATAPAAPQKQKPSTVAPPKLPMRQRAATAPTLPKVTRK